MLFREEVVDGIAAGRVTLAFRRPWTAKVLALIEAKPGVPARRLASALAF